MPFIFNLSAEEFSLLKSGQLSPEVAAYVLSSRASDLLKADATDIRMRLGSVFSAAKVPVLGTIPVRGFDGGISNFTDACDYLTVQRPEGKGLVEIQELEGIRAYANLPKTATSAVVAQTAKDNPPITAFRDQTGGRKLYTQSNSQKTLVADPVDFVTGGFVVEAVDLAVAGPFPFFVSRNYSSLNQMSSAFGYGWKGGVVPYMSMQFVAPNNPPGVAVLPATTTLNYATTRPSSSDTAVAESGPISALATVRSQTNAGLPYTLFAAEIDGSVVAYDYDQPSNRWVPKLGSNPTLINTGSAAASPLNSWIERVPGSAAMADRFILHSADGSKRTYLFAEFPIDKDAKITRRRPYLEKWEDPRGNTWTFEYGWDWQVPEHGEIVKVTTSNGNYVGFHYNGSAQIVDAYTNDGRWVYYDYNDFGDLIRVIKPDGAEFRYEYQVAEKVVEGRSLSVSTHLLAQEMKPDGRLLSNSYDAMRRVVVQRSTAGKDLALVQAGQFQYDNVQDSATGTISGTTTFSDAYGRVTVYKYNQGLVTDVVNPLGETITQQWYGEGTALIGNARTAVQPYPDLNQRKARSLAKSWDKRGLETTLAYDSAGNLVQRTISGNLTGHGTARLSWGFQFERTPDGVQRLAKASVPLGDGSTSKDVAIQYESPQFPTLPTSVTESVGSTQIRIVRNDYYTTGVARGLLKSTRTSDPVPKEPMCSIERCSIFAASLSRSRTKPTATPIMLMTMPGAAFGARCVMKMASC
jgi:YD repeat-containing protein